MSFSVNLFYYAFETYPLVLKDILNPEDAVLITVSYSKIFWGNENVLSAQILTYQALF